MSYIPDSENVLSGAVVVYMLSIVLYDSYSVVCHYQLAWSRMQNLP